MPRHLVTLLLAAGTLTACAVASDPLVPLNFAAGTVAISLDKSSYTWTEASSEGLRGTIRNTSDRMLFSAIGDAMIISSEQDLLLISNFSDGKVERLVGSDAWTRVPTATSIEGTRFVLLRPGRSYRFIGQLSGTPQLGTHRVAVSYRTTINDEEPAQASTDYSAAFEVR